MKIKSIWKKIVDFFYIVDRSCPICNLTNTEHEVEHVPDGPQRDGYATSSFTFKTDEDGNLWRVDFNRLCRRCGHIWYVPTGLSSWDTPRLEGPQLVSTFHEEARINAYMKEHGSIPEEVFARIACEERLRAGFFYKNGNWVRNSKPPR